MTKVIYGDKRRLGLTANAVDFALWGGKRINSYQTAEHPAAASGYSYQINDACGGHVVLEEATDFHLYSHGSVVDRISAR